ncbi:MAG: CcmD family protein [Bacteroidetes bacterium]|nr:MAG: CcmD family protein [Bacteroidota bacterium]
MINFVLLLHFSAYSQKVKIGEEDYQNSKVEMADQFRADGKIYVVVAVIMTIFAGITTYLFVLDKKITHLENLNKK